MLRANAVGVVADWTKWIMIKHQAVRPAAWRCFVRAGLVGAGPSDTSML